jgi:choline dehydrogenase-like flavoprotein
VDEVPRAVDGRAPDVFRRGGWVPTRCFSDADEVDFAIVGTGAGGGTLAGKLAEAGMRVVAFDAGPFWRPLEDFTSDEAEQEKLYWSDDRITAGRIRSGSVATTAVAAPAAPDLTSSGAIEPFPEAQKIAGLMAFYNERVDLYVDGVLQERPSTKFS